MKKIAVAMALLIVLSLSPMVMGAEERMEVVSTLALFSTIVEEIGGEFVNSQYIVPPGTDIHSYSLTYEDVKRIENADLVVLASSEFFSLDENIKEKVEGKPVLDFPDYNATIYSLGDIKRNIHGYWLYPQNAMGIAKAVCHELSRMDPEHSEYYHRNLERFEERVNDTMGIVNSLSQDAGILGKKALIAVPGVYYVVRAAGMEIEGSILKGPNQFIGNEEMREIEERIRSGEVGLIVNAAGLENSRAGEIAKQISKDTGVKIAYVDIFSADNYTTLLLKDAAVLSSAGSVEVYSSGECNLYPYVISIAIALAVSGVLALMAYRYRKELVK